MNLRTHQTAMIRICDEILARVNTRKIIASVTPGGGKSALPAIIADKLIPAGLIDHIVWVVPRNSLRDQGESDFPEWGRFRIRAAGNESDPCRGTQGYVTTYQAIAADPERHQKTFGKGTWALFLDEPHHVVKGGEWEAALQPLVSKAAFLILASGTFARGDGKPIAFLDYDDVGLPCLGSRPGIATIQYSRSQALREGAVCPVYFRHLDGRAEWADEEGARHAAETLEDDSDALFTALRTEYAQDLLDATVADWLEHRQSYPAAKLLVVAPNIALAREYFDHLSRRQIPALMAASDDSPAAAQAIARFKGKALPSIDVLVTVAMAYEGMSVPEVTHIACLTHIRSVPWLEQCFARANRRAPGKVAGWIWGPADARLKSAIAAIEAEQLQALRDSDESADKAEEEEAEEGKGGRKPGITPIGSAAYGKGPLFEVANSQDSAQSVNTPRPDGGLGPREAERLLRKQISDHAEILISRRRPGSRAAMRRILMGGLKDLVGGKGREDCTTEELVQQLAWLKERYPL